MEEARGRTTRRAEPMGCTHGEERGSDEDEAHVESAD
jgi:hypothetical protein